MMFIRLMPMANLGLDIALRLTTNLRAGGNVAEMLKAAADIGPDELLPSLPPDARIETIEFDNVNFAYGSTANLVFRNFSRVLRAGRSYAVIGSSGAGKSTLVDLLLKFFAPQSGTIRVNGQDIALLSAKALRARMVLSEQTTHIFHGTVTENVKLGEKVNDEKAHEALDFVGLQDLLDSLPNGANTLLTFRGSNFSGGQRQRVGLARALMRTADVLILDESTNALDSQTRDRILDKLFSLYRDRILVFVTHDMHIVGRVDEVIDLNGGQTLEERGPGDPLPASVAQEQGASIS